MNEGKARIAYILLNSWRIIPIIIFINLSNNKKQIMSDVERWSLYYTNYTNNYYKIGHLLLRYKEYRNVLECRLHKNSVIQSAIMRLLFPPLDSLYINTENIGSGFFIHHGFSTIINACSIGDNCWINQQVTIGMKNNKKPVIGSNVKICAGAIIVGGITVGDNAILCYRHNS